MNILLEKSTRAGISYISDRYSKANKKYLKSYYLEEETKHIIHLDANNSYDYAMPKFFPTSRFKWINPKEVTLNILAIVQKDVLLKLISKIQKNIENYEMIIL